MQSFDEVVHVAVVADVERLSGPHARLLAALSQSSLPGFRVDLPGSGVPVGADHDLVHLLTPLAGAAAMASEHGIGLVAGFGTVAGQRELRDCRMLLSPGPSADAQLLLMGAAPGQLQRWQPAVDPECFGPGHYSAEIFGGRGGLQAPGADRINVLFAGEPERPELLALAFGAAARREPRLHLVMLTDEADLPQLYASADLLLHDQSTRDFPLDIIEAQASGLPVLAVDCGAAHELIEDGRTGVLVPPQTEALAEALLSLARRATLRERLTVGGLSAIRSRTWRSSLAELTDAWTTALAPAGAGLMRAA